MMDIRNISILASMVVDHIIVVAFSDFEKYISKYEVKICTLSESTDFYPLSNTS
jgi:hypothetical protein